MEEYPEPRGCYNEPGFVKNNPLNNETYLQKCCEAIPEWSDILRETHAKLEALAPGYNIAQIKEKFGGLRYYIDMPEHIWDDESVAYENFGSKVSDEVNLHHSHLREQASQIIREAEEKVYAL